jgi:Flp pilus assembly protein CpaB
MNGVNATLDLTPAQAEIIVLAQRTGLLSLALRSTSDANEASEPHQFYTNGLTVVRSGHVEHYETGLIEQHVVSREQITGRATD